MKKFLLSAAALVCAASVNAQVLQLNAEELGIGSDAVDVAEGQVWGTAGFVELSNAYATQHKAVDCKNNNYNQVLFNGTDIILTKGGIQGQDNPKDIDGGNPGVTLIKPSTGAVVKLTAAADGYVYVVAKLSSNKNYYVFEEGTAIGFTLAMQVEAEGLPTVLTYEAKGEGEFNEITDAGWCDWPENVYYNKVLGQEKAADIKKNGLGVIGFPVYEGCEYLVGAGGSKISWCGAYYCEAPVSVVLQGTDAENPVADCVLLGDGPTPGPEPAENVLWEGSKVMDASWPAATFEASKLTGAAAGDQIVVSVKVDEAINKDWQWGAQVFIKADWKDWLAAQNPKAGAAEDNIVFTLTEELLAAGLNANEIEIQGMNVEVTKAVLVKGGTGINNVKAEASATVSYNLFGQKANATSGLMIKNGNKVLVK